MIYLASLTLMVSASLVNFVGANERHVVMPVIVDADEYEVFHDAYHAVHHRTAEYEPAETRLYLLHLKDVLETYKGKFRPHDHLDRNKCLSETKELIGVAQIVPEKCNKVTFERIQKLLANFKHEASLAFYIRYHKKRLGEFCDKILDEREL